MFQSLPQETVFEARAKAKRDTVIFVTLLFLIYGGSFALMGLALVAVQGSWVWELGTDLPMKVAALGVGVGVLLGLSQYLLAKLKTLDELLKTLSAQEADPNDEYHERLIRLVREAETATGLRGLRVTVIPSPGLNAFSLADDSGAMAIGVTEGLVGRLDRAELSAVVAHEAAHLVQGDSRLLTVAGSLCASFEAVTDTLSPFREGSSWTARTSTMGRSRGGGGGTILLVWVVAAVGKFVSKMLSMALSRSREYMADAQAVRMTKNPLALASALRKIAGKYRGASDPPDGFQMVFILNPEAVELDESEGVWADMFSTHPPVYKRIGRLLDWAKSDAHRFEADASVAEAPATASAHPKSPEPRYCAYIDENWQGPFTFTQWLASGKIRPDTWVCPEGGDNVARAADSTGISQLFASRVQESVAREHCPHCHVPLVQRTYEGAPVRVCTFCSGALLTSQILERIVARRSETFSEGEVQEALAWRKAQKEVSIKEADCGVAIHCPQCSRVMSKVFHLMLTRVVLDRCSYDGMVWLDGGELERIQILVEQSARLYPQL